MEVSRNTALVLVVLLGLLVAVGADLASNGRIEKKVDHNTKVIEKIDRQTRP